MTDYSAILAAVAATIAAGLAGLNLYLTGRREYSKWVREALIDAYVSYLNASFTGGGASRALLAARNESASVAMVEELIERVRSARRQQTDVLTRLRLLADSDVVGAAENTLMANSRAAELVLDPSHVPDVESWAMHRESLKAARDSFIAAARGSMRLGSGRPIDLDLTAAPPRLWRHDSAWSVGAQQQGPRERGDSP